MGSPPQASQRRPGHLSEWVSACGMCIGMPGLEGRARSYVSLLESTGYCPLGGAYLGAGGFGAKAQRGVCARRLRLLRNWLGLVRSIPIQMGLVGAAILRLRSGSQHRRRQDRYPIEGCLRLCGWRLRWSGRKTQEISPGTGKPRYRAARSEGARFPSGTRPRDPGQDRGNKHGATWSIISFHKLRVGLLPPAWPGSHSEVIFETVFRSDGKERQENPGITVKMSCLA